MSEFKRLREKVLPNLLDARCERRNYRKHPIDSDSPYRNEELVDIIALNLKGKNYYSRHDNPPYYESIPGSISKLYLRRSVAERLVKVENRLNPMGLRLFIHDGLRPIEVQRHFHDVWMPARVKEWHPNMDDVRVVEEVEKYWARPADTDASPSPHATGGATDLTLSFIESGDMLYMGSTFDDVSVLAHTDYFEHFADSRRFSDTEARANRRLLYWVMAEEGFVNNPNEWWHFCWGDQMWAKLTGERAAHYGVALFP